MAAGNAASAGLLRRLWLRPDGLPALGVWQATAYFVSFGWLVCTCSRKTVRSWT